MLRAAVAAALALTAASTSAAPKAQSVPVTLREYAIIMPLKLKPGRTTFILRNLGTFPHNFTAIYGPVKFASGDVDPGHTKRLTVKLVPGVYVIACTVLNGGHLAQGMITRFTIGTRAHGSATWHYP